LRFLGFRFFNVTTHSRTWYTADWTQEYNQEEALHED